MNVAKQPIRFYTSKCRISSSSKTVMDLDKDFVQTNFTNLRPETEFRQRRRFPIGTGYGAALSPFWAIFA